jgi:EmrB/QacA subfamily drug resistance transporter
MTLQDKAGIVVPAVSPETKRKLGIALLVIATAQLMLVLDDTIMNVALPTIQRALHVATPNLNWVITAYVLTFGGLLLAGGRAGDLFGRRRVFRFGLALFALASLTGGLAPNEPTLIGARLVQGVGAAIAAPTALSLLATTFPAGEARNKALGVYGAMGGLGSVVGLLLGGAFTEYASWRWVLFVNVPIAVVVLLSTSVLVAGNRDHGALDLPGAVTATLGIGGVIYAVSRSSTYGWSDPGTIASLAAGAVLLIAFLVVERFSRAPMVPARVLADRNRAGAFTVMLLAGGGMLAMFYFLTLYLQVVRGYAAMHTGLAYLPFVVGIGMAAGGVGPKLLGALPARVVIATGMVLGAGGVAWYQAITPATNYYAVVLPAMVVSGFGAGLAFIGSTVVAMRNVAPRDTGIAAGLLNTSQQLGGAIGLAALAAVASVVSRSRLASNVGRAAALTDGYKAGLLVGAVIFAVGAVVAFIVINARVAAAEAAGH